MDTWATHAVAHATLTSGTSLAAIPVIGSASTDGFALGLSCAGLALAAVNSPWSPRGFWRPSDALQHTVRWSRSHLRRGQHAGTVLAGDDGLVFDRPEASRPYADLEPIAEPGITEPDLTPDDDRQTDQSRLRQRVNVMLAQLLGDDADEPAAEQVTGQERDFDTEREGSEAAPPSPYTPRHAAPPVSLSAKLANPRLPGLVSKSSHAGW